MVLGCFHCAGDRLDHDDFPSSRAYPVPHFIEHGGRKARDGMPGSMRLRTVSAQGIDTGNEKELMHGR